MHGGHGFIWASREVALRFRHPGCKCAVVADFDTGNPKLKGYEPEKNAELYNECEKAVRTDAEAKWAAMTDEERAEHKGGFGSYLRNRAVEERNVRIDRERRIGRRIEGAEVLHRDFCPKSIAEVRAQRAQYDAELKRQWNEYTKRGKTAEAYAETVGSYVEGLVSSGRLRVEPFVDLKLDKGKEVQLAKWLADAGHEVLLRSTMSSSDTNDALIDAVVWEFKRIESSNPRKITQRIMEKVPRQGPRFVVDLSESGVCKSDAQRKVAELLDRRGVTQIMLVHEGSLTLFTK